MDRMASKLGGKASVSAVYGDPLERGGVTVIPVARVSLGFGVGAGRGHRDSRTDEGGGGGGGAAAVPVGHATGHRDAGCGCSAVAAPNIASSAIAALPPRRPARALARPCLVRHPGFG